VNVLWALFNMAVGYILFSAGNVSSGNNLSLLVFFAGIAAISTFMSIQFATKKSG